MESYIERPTCKRFCKRSQTKWKKIVPTKQNFRTSTYFKDLLICYILTFDPAQNGIQEDAPEGSDTFQWQLGEEIAWAEIGSQNGTS